MRYKDSQFRQRGFTLIELLVAAGIFVIVMTVVGATFSRFVMMQRRSIAENRMLEEVRLALELFSRETRTAYGITYDPTAADELLYRNQNGYCVMYRLHEEALQRAEHNTPGSDCDDSVFSEESFADLTGAGVQVANLFFNVRAATKDGGSLTQQGFVTISMEAQSESEIVPPLMVKSSVTSRQTTVYVSQ
ncbi:MAG: type II secretion system protein [Candidatus Andersenbacteria bacterium]